MSLSRRSFLKKGAYVATSATIAPHFVVGSTKIKQEKIQPSPLNKWPGRCVLNYNNKHNSVPTGGSDEDEAIIKRMVDDSIKMLTGETTVGEAWKAIFPSSLSRSTKIAIKVCCLNNRIPSHPFVVMGIVEGLQQMTFTNGDFPASNITIYDGNNSNSFSSVGFTQERFPGSNLQHYTGRNVYPISGTNYTDGALNEPYSPVLHDSDFLINVPNLRGHSSHGEGFTLGFKSHFGSYNPEHTNYPEYLRDYNCTGPVYNKTVCTVISALFGKKEWNGPTGSAEIFSVYPLTMDPSTDIKSPNSIILSTDPVTAEFQAIKILRVEENNPYTVNDLPKYLRASAGISGALDPTYNIGIINEAEMDYRQIINNEETASSPTTLTQTDKPLLLYQSSNYPHVFIDVIVHGNFKNNHAKIIVYTARGRQIRELSVPLIGIRTRIVWDGKDNQGRYISSGKYIFKLTIGRICHVNTISLVL